MKTDKQVISLIENYERARDAIYEHVGFVEDWVVCPIDNCTNSYWQIKGNSVLYADFEEKISNKDGDFYMDDIYMQRFYKKHIYRGKEITMIFCDPHVDGMKWFRIFDNKKEVK